MYMNIHGHIWPHMVTHTYVGACIYVYIWCGVFVLVLCSVDSLLGGNFSVLVIKLDHEVGLRRYWYQYRQNFEPDLSMTRPYEANLGPKKAQNNFLKVAEDFQVEN